MHSIAFVHGENCAHYACVQEVLYAYTTGFICVRVGSTFFNDCSILKTISNIYVYFTHVEISMRDLNFTYKRYLINVIICLVMIDSTFNLFLLYL